jgi:hypothetical protein
MTRSMLVGVAVGLLTAGTGLAQQSTSTGTTSLGSVRLTQKVIADGKPLAAGTYMVRLTADEAKPPATGQTPSMERWVEFLQGGQVKGREVVTIIPDSDIAQVAKGPRPAKGASRVEMLKGNDYLRLWINRAGNNYLIHLPPAEPAAKS